MHTRTHTRAHILISTLAYSQGMVIEAILTLVLSMAVFATVDNCRPDLKGSGPLAVGLTVAATNLFGVSRI